MASGYEQRRLTQHLKGPSPEAADQDKQVLEQLDEGQELSAEQAAKVAAQLGNAALAGMLAGQKGGGALEGVEGQDQEEEVEVEIVEDIGEEADVGDQELEAPSYGGGPPPAGGGAGDGSGDGDPWDVGRLFGGDDDGDDPSAPTRTGRLAPSPRRSLPSPLDDPFEERPDELLRDEDLEPLDHLLGPTPERPDAERLGDSCFLAVEAALSDPRALGRRALEPEDLIDAEGTTDPLGRPSEIGRFLAEAAEAPRARSLGRTLATATAALAPVASGYAGAAARLCSLAVCAEALEGGGDRTDRAVTLALAWGAWPEAVDAARPMAQEGRLHAHEVLDTLVGEVAEKDPERRRLPEPGRLGGKALQRVVPEPYLPEVPLIDLEAMDRQEDPDPDVAELDRWLDALVQGGDPDAEPDPDPPVDAQLLQPALHAARYLMNAIGRCHVELAAGALAVWQIRPGAPVRGPLRVADQALHQLARGVLKAGRKIERAQGRPRSAVEEGDLHRVIDDLRLARQTLRSLRAWGLDTLAGALDA